MNVEYDPEREAGAAMKLAADGAERQRSIHAALAWIITRLRAPIGRGPREETA